MQGTASQSSLRFRRGSAEVPRVTRLQREDDRGRGAEQRRGRANLLIILPDYLHTRMCDRACVCCTASMRAAGWPGQARDFSTPEVAGARLRVCCEHSLMHHPPPKISQRFQICPSAGEMKEKEMWGGGLQSAVRVILSHQRVSGAPEDNHEIMFTAIQKGEGSKHPFSPLKTFSVHSLPAALHHRLGC